MRAQVSVALAAVSASVTMVSGCGDDPTAPAATTATTAAAASSTAASVTTARTGQPFPDVVAVEAERSDDGTWTFHVTLSSPYDTPERYADGWRVVGPDGTLYGVHHLTHDHANEQPFTRTQRGVAIPDGVGHVTVEGRDLANGFGGTSLMVTLDRN